MTALKSKLSDIEKRCEVLEAGKEVQPVCTDCKLVCCVINVIFTCAAESC